MSAIDKIKAPINKELKEFETFFKESVNSKVALLDIITNYIIRRKGKQMRPIIVFLSGKLNGEISKRTFNAATLIEIMHTATLIHDDVVDESETRRGFWSVNALWKSKIAVLVGDYLLSKGLLLAVDNNEFDLLKIVSEAVKEMAEGELLQIEKARRLNITEEIYYEIIYKKTATLISACAASGAKSVNANDEVVEKMKLFGKYTGIAFQIKDDLFDYQKTNLSGKPVGNDIQEKKMTLPLIYALSNADKTENKNIKKLVNKSNKSSKNIEEIINFVIKKGGLIYTENKMNEYKNKAVSVLDDFPDNDAKTALIKLLDYIVEREK